MEEIRINENELNKSITEATSSADIPEENKSPLLEDIENIPRDPAGKILVEQIATGTDAKGNRIIPDEIFDRYYRELPTGIINASRTWRTTPSGGKIKIFGGDPEADRPIQIKGAETVNAAKAQRRTFAEVIEEMLVKPASARTIEDLELTTGATNLDAIIASALKQAGRGNVKAMDFLRDTIGQKPTDKLEAGITALTPEDKAMIENISDRLNHNI